MTTDCPATLNSRLADVVSNDDGTLDFDAETKAAWAEFIAEDMPAAKP